MYRIEEVVEQGTCIGCGGCSVRTQGAIPITLTKFGTYTADLSNTTEQTRRDGSQVCPFSDESKNEDQLSNEIFPASYKHHSATGTYLEIYAGRSNSDAYLTDSSSGGLTSWIASQLLERGLVDAIVHVAPSDRADSRLFSYQISDSAEQFLSARKSNYYSTTFADVLNKIRTSEKRYAIIAVPCFIRSARLVCREDPELSARIPYFLGLVCGHMKSSAFAESLAWQVGVPPHELGAVDFRVKVPGRSSSDYNFSAKSNRTLDRAESRKTNSLVGGNWGHGMFQMNACNYCDDIFAETADVAFGDAWLPEYKSDWRGTNVIVVRNREILEILDAGVQSNDISLDTLDASQAASSQAGNFRHRRIGLAVRLQDDIDDGRPFPTKRVPPGRTDASAQRVKLIRQRRLISEVSHTAFLQAKEKGDFSVFLGQIEPLVDRYRKIERGSVFQRIAKRVRRALT